MRSSTYPRLLVADVPLMSQTLRGFKRYPWTQWYQMPSITHVSAGALLALHLSIMAWRRVWESNGLCSPVMLLLSSRSCKHAAHAGTSSNLLAMVAQQSTKLNVTVAVLPGAIFKFSHGPRRWLVT